MYVVVVVLDFVKIRPREELLHSKYVFWFSRFACEVKSSNVKSYGNLVIFQYVLVII